jgi:prolyl oligopeptidase
MPRLPTRTEMVTETLHGVEIVDPYRWLEDGDSPEVHAWVATQNSATVAALESLPARPAIHARLSELLRIGMLSTPVPRGQWLFYERRDGEQDQPVLYVRRVDDARGAARGPGAVGGPGAAERVLIDTNALDPSGTTALDWWIPSLDGNLLAYGLSEGGSERSVLRVRDVESGRDHSDVIPHCRAASIAWEPGGAGFYYTRYPAPGEVPAGEENYRRRVFHHRLGRPWPQDPLVFGAELDPHHWPMVQLSSDGRWLLCTVQKGWTSTELYLRDLRDPRGAFEQLAAGVEAIFAGDLYRDCLYVTTNWDAPRFRALRADLDAPQRAALASWTELLPEGDGVLQGALVIGGRLFAVYLEHAHSRVRAFELDGRPLPAVDLPALGTIEGPAGEEDGDAAWFLYSSFFVPPTVYRLDLETWRSAERERIRADVDPARYESRQVWYESKDGTRVSMFLTHRRGLRTDGDNPTLLYGYGGFSVPLTPAFQRNTFLWLESGGVLAVPNLRGGGEYGEGWHEAGMLEHKQNSFDDFLAAARWLIDQRITRPQRLGIMGGSNGGLLVGAALTQAPELFAAAVCQVPLLDMLRYPRFLLGRLWIPEYGDPDDPEQFRWLLAYSPYHRVREGATYPATLIMTSEEDTRVDPMHARKMAARLQASTPGEEPILLRIESRAGHGAGKPISKTLAEYTDIWSFLFWRLRLSPPAAPGREAGTEV